MVSIFLNCINMLIYFKMRLPGGSVGNAGGMGLIWVGKILWKRAQESTRVFLPGESHGQRSLGRLQSMGSQRVRNSWSELARIIQNETMWFDKVLLWIFSSTFALNIFVTNFKVDLPVLKQPCELFVFLWGVQLWIKPL